MTHHNHGSNRPKIIDHTIAYGLLGGLAGAVTGSGSLMRIWTFVFGSVTMLAPMTYWFMMNGVYPGASHRRPANIFYEDSVTPEEVAQIRAQDEMEILAHNMTAKPGYGFERMNMRFDN